MRISRTFDIPDEELRVRFSRAGGPGGQNVNKRSTKVEVTFDVAGSPSLSERRRSQIARRLASRIDSDGVLHVTSQDARTQKENRERALERLRKLLAQATAPPPKPRVATKPSRSATERRLDEKRVRGRKKRLRAKPALEE